VAPDFQATDINGKLFTTKSAATAPIILRFFDPYCKYCKADTVVFNQYYRKNKAKGLRVVYIDTDESVTTIKEFIKDLKIEFPVIVDQDQKLANLYVVQVIPQTVVLDKDHKIVGVMLGGVSEAELEDLLHLDK